ncbi:uncharacterized protein PHACADRAFT_204941 [Phanerochaete carnosa HHB-10118-sp]|uniref:Uncharacterized protein n=1 Tax=Phanerochaete carnosa (strain HHB-10118-sp) TaxID=650164 RepID=K5XFD8_PHACS|nr:uncharacterized protein PHACADRAFT_204941 [Phanerochaete carnosa HHB-10118-sp]EKM61787.1 hypothetical protein PHACADRAFT_204941 [Phanerochaete carnosa HHB-10118-sp]
MPDPRFARLKNDPRFRQIRKKEAKVVVDERFKSIFDGSKGKKKDRKGKGRVDKYGRQVSETHDQDNLKRFYRLEGKEEEEEEVQAEPEAPKRPDYARGEVLLESSDEDDIGSAHEDNESDSGGVVTLGRTERRHVFEDPDEPEIDLDEDSFADLDAQATAYAKEHNGEDTTPDTDRTRRLAVVNLDWDHVKAQHLYKIFSSLVSPTGSTLASAPSAFSSKESGRTKGGNRVVRGKILSVRVYPSEFGKERLAREEQEGPPPELFNSQDRDEVGDAEDYNEAALRKYQLERLRYYYAIVECNTVEAASHIYNELEGTELERSANVFDLSFVPDEMTFDGELRDEATEDVNAPYKPLDFTTDALRHSKVKLTWDDDDPERLQVTRRALTRKEIEENDFRKADREKLRALLLGGGDDTLPEGWNKGISDDEGDVDVEITFTPGLSEQQDEAEETTIEKYARKMKEKKQKRKVVRADKKQEQDAPKKGSGLNDDFFGGDSSDESDDESEPEQKKGKKSKNDRKGKKDAEDEPERQGKKVMSTAEELALVAISDDPHAEPRHFDMKAVLKAEKSKGNKRKGKKGGKGDEEEQELQEDFAIDVKDERFKALHEDHTFAIDPSNPHFKKTKSMSALLEERVKRQKEKLGDPNAVAQPKKAGDNASSNNLKSLVESVKRKSAAANHSGVGKRRKL